MKRTLIMAAIGATTIFCGQNAAAEDLVVKTGSGSTKFALADVTSLKFNDGKLQSSRALQKPLQSLILQTLSR